eukprot:1418756-Rhodomonas_salina.1
MERGQGVRVKIEGTVSYLPPEIGDEQASRRRMDIWVQGSGFTVYDLMRRCRRAPFLRSLCAPFC